jgi:hypothetical protein
LLAVKALLSVFERLCMRSMLDNVTDMPEKSMCAGDSFPGLRGCGEGKHIRECDTHVGPLPSTRSWLKDTIFRKLTLFFVIR